MLDYDALIRDYEAKIADTEEHFSPEQRELLWYRDNLRELLNGVRKAQNASRLFQAAGQVITEVTKYAQASSAQKAAISRRTRSKRTKNKTNQILDAARDVMLTNIIQPWSFREIFDRLPEEIQTIWGKGSKEGIRSTLKRVGSRVGIEMTADKRFKITPS